MADSRGTHGRAEPGTSPDAVPAPACAGCALRVGRRDFFREAGAMAIAALALMGPGRAQAESLPVRTMRLLTARGSTLYYKLPTSDGVHIDEKYEVIVARYQGRIYAFSEACPHQHTALRWVSSKDEFECPKHHSKYRPDGTFISGRATRSMDRYAVQVASSQVLVDYAHEYRQDKNPSEWASAFAPVPAGA